MAAATIRQCVVLLCGAGADAALRPCLDRPFLAWLLREFLRFGVEEFLLLTEDDSAGLRQAADRIKPTLPRQAHIAIAQAPPGAGTGGALWHARDRLHARFLLCRGTTLFDCNIAELLSAAARDDAAVIGRMILRPAGGPETGSLALHGDRVVRAQAGGASFSAGGIHVFGHAVLDSLAPRCSLERDVLPRFAEQGVLRGMASEGCFRDIQAPADFAAAQRDMPALLRRRALLLDRDGVLNVDHGYVGTLDRFEWTEGALDAVAYATRAGWHVFLVTNQSGVARGYYDEESVRWMLAWMAEQVRRAGGTIDDARYCPFHEDGPVEAYRGSHPWRKPNPGMLLDLVRAWELDPARCIMVGDQPTDMRAAERAGIAGHLFSGGNLLDFVRPLLASAVD